MVIMNKILTIALCLSIYLVSSVSFAQAPQVEDFLRRVSFGSATDVKYYIDNGMDPNSANDGYNALELAIAREDAESINIVRALVEGGADIWHTNPHGDYALHSAIKHNNIEAVKYIMNMGVSLYAKNNEGLTPEKLAIAYDHPEIVKLIKQTKLARKKALADLRTGENLIKYLKLYSFNHCTQQFIEYHVNSPKTTDANKTILQQVLQDQADESTKYVDLLHGIFDMSEKSLKAINLNSRQAVYNRLQVLAPKLKTAASNVAQDKFVKQRCGKISDKIVSQVVKDIYKKQHSNKPVQ